MTLLISMQKQGRGLYLISKTPFVVQLKPVCRKNHQTEKIFKKVFDAKGGYP